MPEQGNGEAPRAIDRRQFIRRSAVVGGTLLWMAPAVQSLTPPAYADVSPGISTCCQCRKVSGGGPANQCFANDPTADTMAECQSKCAGLTGNYVIQDFHQDFPAGSGRTFSCSGGQCAPVPH